MKFIKVFITVLLSAFLPIAHAGDATPYALKKGEYYLNAKIDPNLVCSKDSGYERCHCENNTVVGPDGAGCVQVTVFNKPECPKGKIWEVVDTPPVTMPRRQVSFPRCVWEKQVSKYEIVTKEGKHYAYWRESSFAADDYLSKLKDRYKKMGKRWPGLTVRPNPGFTTAPE